MDFYKETINPENPLEYRFNDAWRPLTVRPEVIKIKGGAAVTREPKPREGSAEAPRTASAALEVPPEPGPDA